MPLSERTERALEACYDAILAPTQWPSALQFLAESFGAASCTLFEHDRENPAPVPMSVGHEAFADLWARNQAHAPDPHVGPYLELCTSFIRAGWPSALEHDLSTEEDRRTLPFFHETARPGRREWLAMAYFSVEGRDWCFPIYRGGDRGPFTPKDARRLAEVGPYVAKIVSLARKFAAFDAASKLSALQRVSSAAVVIDAAGRATQMNLPAQNLLGADFNLVRGRPAAHDPASNRRLQQLISSALHTAPGGVQSYAPIVVDRDGAPWHTFDPSSMRCANDSDQPNCLTEEQVRVVRDEYRGPSDKDGHLLFDGGEPYGSELARAGWIVMPAADAAAPADSYAAGIGLAFLNDMAFMPNHPGKYSLGSVPFTAAMHGELEQLGGIYNATDPDLSAFAANGGKLIIYHSWADQAIPPFASLDYYRAVVRQAGGLPAAQSFSRLYMVPGLYHCPCGQPVDGDPATTVQFMPQLVAWVERGEAPESITLPITSQTTGTHAASLSIEPFDPMQPAPNNEGLNSNYHYLFETSVYRPGNALWCSDRGQPLSCSRR